MGKSQQQGPIDNRTAKGKFVELLREQPRLFKEMDSHTIPYGTRNIVGKLKPPRSSSGSSVSCGSKKQVLYLWGDERRAVRLFIDANEEYVAGRMASGKSNQLKEDWDDGLYQLLEEEWQLYQIYHVEGDEVTEGT